MSSANHLFVSCLHIVGFKDGSNGYFFFIHKIYDYILKPEKIMIFACSGGNQRMNPSLGFYSVEHLKYNVPLECRRYSKSQ